MKPLLAMDVHKASCLVFPCGVQPKIDGVRGLTTEGRFTGRSLKPPENLYTAQFYSDEAHAWMDGEVAAADERDPELCRKTSSVLSTITGEPFTYWHVFDYLHKHIREAPYKDRHEYLVGHIASQHSRGLCGHVKVVQMQIVKNMAEADAWEELWLEQGYEGIIYRNLNASHKEGRSSKVRCELLRKKQFIDGEAMVESIVEGNENTNEAQTNELGRTFRTSHLDGKVPNGMVGNLQCRLLADVEFGGKVILQKDQLITVSPGTMTLPQRKHYFEHPEEVVRHVVKYKFFPKGIKDKPRFPTYQSHRSAVDMS